MHGLRRRWVATIPMAHSGSMAHATSTARSIIRADSMTCTDFHHEAFFYGDPDEFLDRTVPFLQAALENGEPALVAVSRPRAGALAAELGGEAAEVEFADMEELGRNPARIIPFWRAFVDEYGGGERPLRGIGEPVWPGRSAAEVDECQRHEALLNFAFADGPGWQLLCPYDTAALDAQILEAARQTHPVTSGTGGGEGSAGPASFDPPAVRPFAGALVPAPPGASAHAFDRDSIHEARSRALETARAAGLSEGRCYDLVTAVGELLANTVMHGGGHGVLRLWRDSSGVVAEVEDAGLIEDPLGGRKQPSPSQLSGRGLWIANQLCDLVQIRSGEAGTAVRLRMELDMDFGAV